MKNLHWWLVLACVPLYGFWIIPGLSDGRPTLQKAIEVEVNKQAKLEGRVAALRSQQREVTAAGEGKPTDFIPVTLEQEYLILDLRRLTQGTGFTTSGFSFTKGRNQVAEAAEMRISFSAEGKSQNLVQLLQAIEQNRRFLGLESLTLSRAGVNGDLMNVSLNLYALAQRF